MNLVKRQKERESYFKMSYQTLSREDFEAILKLPPPEILVYMLRVAEISRRAPDWAPVISYRHIPKEPPKTLIREFGWLFLGPGTSRETALDTEEKAIQRLRMFIPFIDDLKMTGKYCLAGSCPIVACNADMSNATSPGDADFYPYYDRTTRGTMPDKENIMESYLSFLKDMDRICDQKSERPSPFMDKIRVHRNRHCTTIVTEDAGLMCCGSFQIIHRAHTSPVSVVVGFDQICCKCFYDGDQFYFTLDAALALYFGINPIDWRRESPSHLRRAQKYFDKYGFTPIFPGLHFDLGRELFLKPTSCYYLPRAIIEKRTSCWPARNPDKLVMSCSVEAYHMGDVLNREDYEKEDPHSLESHESDYGDENPQMALNYRCLSAAIKEQPEKMLVFAKKPSAIVSNYSIVDVEHTMRRLLTGDRAGFYVGSNRAREISQTLTWLATRKDNYGCRIALMKEDQMALFVQLHEELTAIFEQRCSQLADLVIKNCQHLRKVEFLMSNPGAQFTASFHPIIRKTPQEYFGSRYTPLDITVCKGAKLCCLWMRKRGLLFRGWDINLMKLLFFWVDRAMIYGPMDQRNAPTTSLSETRVPAKPLNPLPWMENKKRRKVR